MALNVLAIPGRLELPTYGLGNRRSIRLSYGTADPLASAGAWGFIAKRAWHRQPSGVADWAGDTGIAGRSAAVTP